MERYDIQKIINPSNQELISLQDEVFNNFSRDIMQKKENIISSALASLGFDLTETIELYKKIHCHIDIDGNEHYSIQNGKENKWLCTFYKSEPKVDFTESPLSYNFNQTIKYKSINQ